MAHLNIYLPDDVAANVKDEARTAGVPLSRFILSRLARAGTGDEWPVGYFAEACGFLAEEIPEPVDLLPEPVETPELQ